MTSDVAMVDTSSMHSSAVLVGKSQVGVNVAPVSSSDSRDGSPTAAQRPQLKGRRRTGEVQEKHTGQIGYDGEEDALTGLGRLYYRILNFNVITRFILYIVPVAAILAIPLVLFDTVYFDTKVGKIRLLGLFIWLEIVWVSLWLTKLVAKTLPFIFQFLCGIVSSGTRKYALLLKAIEVPLSLFGWSIVAYATTPVICVFNRDHCGARWLKTLQRALLATMVVAAMFLVEKFIVQLISVSYHRKQFNARIRESKRTIRILDLMYDASRRLFPSFCPEFAEEDYLIHDTVSVPGGGSLSGPGSGLRFLGDIGRFGDKVTAAFGNMASEITGKEVFNATSAHSIVTVALERKAASEALAKRLWVSFVGEGQQELYEQDIIDILGADRESEARDIFSALDRDGNGDVSLEEMIMLVVEIGQNRKAIARSMHDISSAIAVLDNIFLFIMTIAIALIYVSFFNSTLANNWKVLWTGFTGLSFALGGTITEFLSCCFFLFVKHPFDVSDRIDLSGSQLEVEHISLLYTVFREISTGSSIHIANSTLASLWIKNISRSDAMKEQLSLNVSSSTSFEDISLLKRELQAFVLAPENRRDFQPDLGDVQLTSIGDLKQLELRVEIKHKSNWSNETLRATRRAKFMCALLAILKKIPINGPGGGGDPTPGDHMNPSYSVVVSDEVAAAARAQFTAEKDAKRMYPKNSTPADVRSGATGMSSAVRTMMAAGRLRAPAGGNRSVDTTRTSGRRPSSDVIAAGQATTTYHV